MDAVRNTRLHAGVGKGEWAYIPNGGVYLIPTSSIINNIQSLSIGNVAVLISV